MTLFAGAPFKQPSWPITVGAVGIAAAQFARCGFDVQVQSGRDRPWYDLLVTNAGNLIRVSVKASEDGRWYLTESYLRRAADMSGKKNDCLDAIDLWVDHHGSRTVCCLVQFEGVAIDELPRIYLASPFEIAERMRETTQRLGDPSLYERYEWSAAGDAAGNVETLPKNWRFSHDRVHELLTGEAPSVPAGSVTHQNRAAATIWTKSSATPVESLSPVVAGA
jgi:hypothetical protein